MERRPAKKAAKPLSKAALHKRNWRASKERNLATGDRENAAPPLVAGPRTVPLCDGPLERLMRDTIRLTDVPSVKTLAARFHKHVNVAQPQERTVMGTKVTHVTTEKAWHVRVLLPGRPDESGLSWRDWLRVKETDLPCGKWGLFADTDFEKGQMIGLYLGSTRANPDVSACATRSSKWGLVDPRRGFDEPDNPNFYMGMHLMNDPAAHLPGHESGRQAAVACANTVVHDDLAVCATRNITRGEELHLIRHRKS